MKTLLLSTALCAAVWAHASAEQLENFRSPSGNIFCTVWENDGDLVQSVRCDILRTNNLLPVPRPRWCDGDYGNAFEVSEVGRSGTRLCATDSAISDNTSVLPYGAVARFGGLACKSETAGLGCINERGHGFFLSKSTQRIF
jgi:hypothetical protein